MAQWASGRHYAIDFKALALTIKPWERCRRIDFLGFIQVDTLSTGQTGDCLVNPVTLKKKQAIAITDNFIHHSKGARRSHNQILDKRDLVFVFTLYMSPLAFSTCWDCGSFCPKWRLSGRIWAGRLAPSASSPAWAGEVLEGSPWALEDGTPPR